MSELPASFGHYRVVGRLGAGGMGQVLLAHDPRLERDVALKVLPPELARDPEALARFRREALMLASLNHPNIATLHGFEEDQDGTVALVLERVEGESLADRTARGPLATEEALRVCAQIAEALEVAHERGVIHRDLKPGNVMIGPRGLVKVLDFGIAKRASEPAERAAPAATGAITMISPPPSAPAAADPPSAHADETFVGPRTERPVAASRADAPITQWGVVVGTPSYMSPEQVRAGDQDSRTDIFSFGCVLYECLTGLRAFRGDHTHEVMQRVLDETPDMQAIPAAVSAQARTLIERCLEKDRDRRLSEVRDARYQLEEMLGIRRASAVRGGEAPATPNNLPATLSRFIGREALIASGTKRLAATRLLSLAGIGGSGKTRLALRIAEESFGSFPDGVWFVDLMSLQEPDRVPESVARVAGVTEDPGTPVVEALARHFRTRRALLLMDNCEDVIAGCAPLVQRLLADSPGLRVLATTREPLGVAGEEVTAVPPLALPPDPARASLEAIAASESVALFVERAKQAQPGFELSAANASAVAAVCRHLDGIPLAIELAAARTRVLSIDEIRARLGDRFKLLGGATTTLVGRRQTLRATIAWSVDHVAADERELFRTLAVFVGGWTLEGALAVSAGEPDEFDLLDAIQRLVHKSLVVVMPSSGGSTRYRYLESVREFALELLAAAGERDGVCDRHLSYFANLAAASPAALAGPDQKSELLRLDLAHDDLLAAFAWSAGRPDGARLGLRLAGSMWRYWSARGHFALGRRTLAESLARDTALT
ncbi:MAG: protein kinase, partial [Candidatus Eisenbacteria bacterium]|nr:protein kinase [Candidatus Eisenbacteria bacterium]